MAKKTFFIKIGGGESGAGAVNYGWNSTDIRYPAAVQTALGAELVAADTKGVAFGINSPKPPLVTLALANGKRLKRFCAPASLGAVLGGSLIGTALAGSTITQASV